jgi:hypothetical protein
MCVWCVAIHNLVRYVVRRRRIVVVAAVGVRNRLVCLTQQERELHDNATVIFVFLNNNFERTKCSLTGVSLCTT